MNQEEWLKKFENENGRKPTPTELKEALENGSIGQTEAQEPEEKGEHHPVEDVSEVVGEPTPAIKQVNLSDETNKIVPTQDHASDLLGKIKVNVIPLAIGALLLIGTGVITNRVTHNADMKMATSYGVTLKEAQDKLDDLEKKIDDKKGEIESQNSKLKDLKEEIETATKKLPKYNQVKGGKLSTGTYTVGSDLKEGVYDLTYKTTMSEDDYWGNDYLWIIHDGSNGANETLGGTKYDDRYGGFDFSKASKGTTVHVTLKHGDKVTVDADEGDWTY
jgi:hypothetical protein